MLKLNVGFNRKLGEANYGSRGASVNLELELDSGLVGDPDKLKERIRRLFALAKESVNEELNSTPTTNGNHEAESNGNGHTTNGHTTNGNGHAKPAHQASQKQLDYASQLAGQITGLGLRRVEGLAQKLFAKPLAGLSSFEASSLIDTLKQIKAGKLELAAALQGVAV